jgi:hypothetical protein
MSRLWLDRIGLRSRRCWSSVVTFCTDSWRSNAAKLDPNVSGASDGDVSLSFLCAYHKRIGWFKSSRSLHVWDNLRSAYSCTLCEGSLRSQSVVVPPLIKKKYSKSHETATFEASFVYRSLFGCTI